MPSNIILQDCHNANDVLEVEAWEGTIMFIAQEGNDKDIPTACIMLKSGEVARLLDLLNEHFAGLRPE